MPIYVDDALTTILVCDSLSAGYDSFANARNAKSKTYVTNILYNITNPAAYLLGDESADVRLVILVELWKLLFVNELVDIAGG